MNGKVESSARGGEPENKTNRRNFATKLFLLVIHTYKNNAKLYRLFLQARAVRVLG